MHWLLGGWGDAEFVTLTPDLGRYFGAEKGVLVARAPSDASLGLKDGDVIVAIGGREPQNGPHAMRILRSYQPGESVELRILRDRRAQTLTATIPERAARDAKRHAVPPPRPPAPPAPPSPPQAPVSS
jgi:S1-C subfamily serine protease